jgi:hypothetical protein
MNKRPAGGRGSETQSHPTDILIINNMALYTRRMSSSLLGVFGDVVLCSLAMTVTMEAVSTSETSVNFYEVIRRNIFELSYYIHHNSVS